MQVRSIQKTVVVFSVLLVSSVFFVTRAEENSNSSENLFLDFDQDGISNDEETAYGTDPNNKDTDGDGYSDYTEISSGYDPLKPAPGDRVIEQKNVEEVAQQDEGADTGFTTKVSEDLAVFLSSAMNKDEDVSVEDMYSVVGEVLDKGMDSLKLEDIDEDRIKIKDQSYEDLSDDERAEKIRQDAEEYVSAVSYIMAVNFPDFVEGLSNASSGDVQVFADNFFAQLSGSYLSGKYAFINEFSDRGDVAMEQMYDVEVPKSLVDVHMQGLKIGQYAKGMKDLIEESSGDPLEDIAYLSMVQGLLVSIRDFQGSVSQRLTDLDVGDVTLDFLDAG